MIDRVQWQSSRRFPFGVADVDIWRVRLDQSPACVQQCRALLSPDEHERATEVLREEQRSRWIVARGALRTILACYVECDPRRLVFGYGVHGKPHLSSGDRLPMQFNLAHSRALGLIVVAAERAVGVDLEYLRPLAYLDRIAADVCSPQEQAYLQRLTSHERQIVFLDCWTRKEAIVKAYGLGLTFDVREIESLVFSDNPAARVHPPRALDLGPLVVRSFRPQDSYIAAVAAAGDDLQPAFVEWSSDMLGVAVRQSRPVLTNMADVIDTAHS
jgi:4'-phosphopantetheinyl transferase